MEFIDRERLLSLCRNPKTRNTLPFLVLAVITFFLINTFRKAFREIGYDFTSYLLSSEAFFSGANPYQTDTVFPFIYPLFICIPLIPLTFLPYWLSVFIWFSLNLAALFFSSRILFRLFKPESSSSSLLLIFCFSFLLLYGIISNNFLNGQINFIVLFLCTLFLFCYLKNKKILASLLLAAAFVTKLTPAVFFVFLFFRKDFKSIFLAILNSLILAVLLPWLFVGSEVFDLYKEYFQSFLVSKLSEEHITGRVSFALQSVVSSVTPGIPKHLTFIVSAIIVLAPIIYVQLKTARSSGHSNIRNLHVFSLYMLSMLLISPMSETHHMIYVYPSVLVIIFTLFYIKETDLHRSLLILGLVFLLLSFGKLIPFGFFMALTICYLFNMWRLRNLKVKTIKSLI